MTNNPTPAEITALADVIFNVLIVSPEVFLDDTKGPSNPDYVSTAEVRELADRLAHAIEKHMADNG
ncbi:MAG: hypothetical protein V4532_12990 [Pseudomonadota bacterium]